MAMNNLKTIAIIAGEYSGDILGASIIQALKQRQPELNFIGIAGPKMLAEGCQSLVPMHEIAVMGFFEVLRHLPRVLRARRRVLKYLKANPPAVFLGIDSPDFNLPIAKKLRKRGIKTIHYNSPTVWAWRQGRVKILREALDQLLVLFPFEYEFLQRHQVPSIYVGHPLADQIPLEIDKAQARQALDLPASGKIIALMTGSRQMEINYCGQVILQAAKRFQLKQNHSVRFISNAVNKAREQQLTKLLKKHAPDLPITIYHKKNQQVLAAADAAICVSGTITLEAMLYKTPTVVVYRMSALTYQIAKRIIKTRFIALPNLIAGKEVFPEFIQEAATANVISEALEKQMNHAEKLLEAFVCLHQQLRCHASNKAADAVLALS